MALDACTLCGHDRSCGRRPLDPVVVVTRWALRRPYPAAQCGYWQVGYAGEKAYCTCRDPRHRDPAPLDGRSDAAPVAAAAR